MKVRDSFNSVAKSKYGGRGVPKLISIKDVHNPSSDGMSFSNLLFSVDTRLQRKPLGETNK